MTLLTAHCEFHRHRHVRRRKRDYATTLATLDRRKTLDLPVEEGEATKEGQEESELSPVVEEELREELLEATKKRYASLKIGGRWQNPFDEWREEGAWEWCVRRETSQLRISRRSSLRLVIEACVLFAQVVLEAGPPTSVLPDTEPLPVSDVR